MKKGCDDMAHIVQCRICHKKINTDVESDWINPTNRMYYHQSCYEDFAKKKGEIREGDIHVEADDDLWKSAVYDYLRKDLKISVNYMKFNSQWEHFLKKNMTAKGMYFSLRYFYEIAKGDPKKCENGIGIIPHIYEEGTCYWGERNLRDKGICARIEAQILKTEATPTKVIAQKRQKPKVEKVDLSAIALMEDDE